MVKTEQMCDKRCLMSLGALERSAIKAQSDSVKATLASALELSPCLLCLIQVMASSRGIITLVTPM